MYKVGVVGDKDSIMGFLALGIDIFPAYDSDEIKKSIHKLVEDEYAIIYITEQASLLAKESIAKYKDSQLPAIIVIPGIGGSMGLGMNEVRESSKRAIGADILFKE
ncbi:ATP synthase (F/14-kDa) subunit [Clostridioides difficile CD200]|uniref:V-type ATP synthase subunit F n=1 Tax=Clostridioides difficile TaxID=1496 RepID=UPI00038D3570|nr:V-type ATP synthase subunit F [Clostridioides difficile]EQF59540.1 ATP synthase (F/14-kDa) subunit [Clostridioides difficile CD200]EQI56241.1 ATP synthase (F/14-kDa) subunit [Clostridioides difficile Y307]EQJ08404.1 ATP synthase (F/14-kDa) subunit [Clostridioides difficile P8]EQJ15407.1 ATP synthase (F/14-kDa) subunit [Clostridioides difficile P11]